MPSSISKTRLRKAFEEGRRAAASETAQNPYDNPKLRRLWDDGRARQRAGELTTPIPPLEHGQRRAQRPGQSPPSPQRGNRPPSPPQRPRPGPGRDGPGRDRPGPAGRDRPRGR